MPLIAVSSGQLDGALKVTPKLLMISLLFQVDIGNIRSMHNFNKRRIVTASVDEDFPLPSECSSGNDDSYGLIMVFDSSPEWNILFCTTTRGISFNLCIYFTIGVGGSVSLYSMTVVDASIVRAAGVGAIEALSSAGRMQVDCFWWTLYALSDTQWSFYTDFFGSTVQHSFSQA